MHDDNVYINLNDFEKTVRNRFKNIIEGAGPVIPRIAVKIALDDVFKPDASQPGIEDGRADRSDCGHVFKCPDCQNCKGVAELILR